MSTNVKNMMREVMVLGWQFIKKNGYSKSEALKVAWMNLKLKAQMKNRIVRFWFQKVDGSLREAWGSLAENIVPPTTGAGRKTNDTCQTYWDSERGDWRCFKKANLLRLV